MKFSVLAVCATLAGCDEASMGALGGSGGGGRSEQMVLGSNISFATCKERGGLIIRDANTSMVACDPRVIRRNQPTDEEEFVKIEES
ncbi:hypothetical protein [Thalassobium sp. R2A62]|uniref:hypothetical protein n=1 Tax=Thalassobium sp. R2A62 TaxID=633131 RepID=UPI0012323D2A|nr:hypothetical protein [Thalassobium sp. R2A62]MDG1802298.1 hypothetical protein [Paracoccaceae bacterium]